MVGVICAPVPLKSAVCGLPDALSAMLTEALSEPTREGVNVTEMVQLALVASVAVQLLVWPKSALFVPVTVMLMLLRMALPVLVKVTA